MNEQLARLLGSTPVAVFFQHFHARRFLHVRADSPDHLDGALSVSDIDRLLQSQQLPAAFFNVVRDNRLAPLEDWSRTGHATRGLERLAIPEKLLALYLEGYTIIINKAYEAIPTLSEVSRRLTSEFGFLVGGNIYITPPGSKGFERHGDPHDVLVLQVSGSKTWILHPPGSGPVEVVLNAGDLLFLPRKMPHEARCCESHSIHASLGLNPVYEFQLIEELAAVASEDPGFQKPVLLSDNFDAAFASRLRDLLARTPVSSLLERRFKVLAETTQRQGWDNRLSDLLQLDRITPDTTVCIRPGAIVRVEVRGDSLVACFSGNELKAPVFLRAAWNRMLEPEPFVVRDLQGLLSPANKVELVRPFIRSGLLGIVRL